MSVSVLSPTPSVPNGQPQGLWAHGPSVALGAERGGRMVPFLAKRPRMGPLLLANWDTGTASGIDP